MTIISLLVNIVYIDLTLSGDNALLLGNVISALPKRRRHFIFAMSGVSIVILRCIVTYFIANIATYPLARILLGIIMSIITIRFLRTQVHKFREARNVSEKPLIKKSPVLHGHKIVTRISTIQTSSILKSIFSLILAGILTSIDNTIAISALFHGNIPVLVLGLSISTTILLYWSTYLARYIQIFQWLLIITFFTLLRISIGFFPIYIEYLTFFTQWISYLLNLITILLIIIEILFTASLLLYKSIFQKML